VLGKLRKNPPPFMQYTVVFDVLQSGYRNWWLAAAGLVFVFASLGAVLFGRRRFRRGRSRLMSFLFLIFAVVWTWEVSVVSWTQYRRLAAALRDGTCEVVEGEVTQFHAMIPSNVRRHVRDQDSFNVGGHHFQYSDKSIGAGFHQISAEGGPLHDGLRVRIHCLGNDIARLEIAR
jgi:hypothetical protein